MSTPESLASRYLRKEWALLTAAEKRVMAAIVNRATVSRDARHAAHDDRTLGERVADRVAAFGGSWTFILLFFAVMIAWTVTNTELLGPVHRAFDPYPYVFLNLMLSMIAALQAPVIMMSQSRQATLDRAHAEAGYEVNLKAELEIRNLHEKLDELREARWAELVRQQERQIELLTELAERQSRPSSESGGARGGA